MRNFIRGLPKAELHIHIEGSLEPELMFALAERNKVELSFNSIEEVKQAYQFDDLQSFLDIYYQAANVLLTEQDFYDLTWAYLEKAHEDNVQHCEIFFDPQTHTDRGVRFEVVILGISQALRDAQTQWGMSTALIMCFLRHLSANSAMQTLRQALPYRDHIIAVGLDSSEMGNPPEKFTDVFKVARSEDWLTVAHAGEEGPADYIWQAINQLQVSRIDHGVACDTDQELLKHLSETRLPLTVCPLSNVKLRVYDNLEQHNIKNLLDAGVCVTINSDDPAYFGGYINENYIQTAQALSLSRNDIVQFARNSFEASFVDKRRCDQLLNNIDNYINMI